MKGINMSQIDFSLLDKNFTLKQNAFVNPQSTNAPNPEEPEQEIINSDDFSLSAEFEAEEEIPVKKEFEGVNKAVLESGKNTQVDGNSTIEVETSDNLFTHVEKMLEDEIEKESQIAFNADNQIQTINGRKIKVLCIGGNEKYYKETFASIVNICPDIEFVKYISNAGNTAFYTIDTTNPDVIVIYHKAQIKNALQFWQTIQSEVDDKGIPYAQKYAEKRIVVLAPNDFTYELDLRRYGINFVVKEINPKTHEINRKELIDQIRYAAKDIVNEKEKKEAVRRQQEELMESYANQETVDEEDITPTTEVEELQIEIGENTNESVEAQDEELENQAEKHMEVSDEPEEEQIIITPPKPAKKKIEVRETMPPMDFSTNNEDSKIICIYSATGGAGTTTFATNLSAILAKYSNMDNPDSLKVALVEYNLSCQSIDLFFNFKSEKNISLLAREVAGYANGENGINMSPEAMRPIVSQYVYKEPQTGLDIYLGITVPVEIDRISSGFTKSFFNTLRTMYDVIIVDTSADVAKTPILEAFGEADEIYYIMPMDVVSIKNTRILIRFFTGLFRFPTEKIKVILNKVNKNTKEFDVQQVYDALESSDCIPEGTIPYCENDILSSINRGIPISLENLYHPVSQAIYSIACGINPMLDDSILTNIDAEPQESGGFLSKLFGGKKKDKKKGLFNRSQDEEAPVQEEKPKRKGLFSRKNKPRVVEEEMELPQIDFSAMEEEKQEKQGFFSRLFGRKKNNKEPDEPEINVKKKKKFGGLLGRGKKDDEEPIQETPIVTQPRSRLKSLGNRPRRR